MPETPPRAPASASQRESDPANPDDSADLAEAPVDRASATNEPRARVRVTPLRGPDLSIKKPTVDAPTAGDRASVEVDRRSMSGLDRASIGSVDRNSNIERPGRQLGLVGADADDSTRGGIVIAGILGAALVIGGGLAYRYLASPETADERDPTSSASASARSSAAPAPAIERCTPLTTARDYTVGDPPKAPAADENPDDDTLTDTPFAAVLGRAISTNRGFAVPVLADAEGGSVMSLVELDDKGEATATRLARSRGDLEPPVVFADGARVLGGALEPNASALSLKLFTVEKGKLTWGAEIDQPHDESLAIDVAASGDRGLAVWDAVQDDISRIQMVSFARDAIGVVTPARAITDEATDAETPRLIARSGGYFLLYRVRGAEQPRNGEKPTAAPERSSKPTSGAPAKPVSSAKAASSSDNPSDEIDESQGEKDYASWIEALKLDPNGIPDGIGEQLTPRDGRVTGYDVAPAGPDGFILAWRDEGGPSGSGGGDVHVLRVSLGGPLPAAIVRERGEGGAPAFEPPHAPAAGVPTLLSTPLASASGADAKAGPLTWLSVPTLRGQSLLAALDGAGAPLEKMAPEATFGFGEPVAARPGDDAHSTIVLVAEPAGRAVRLKYARCAK